MSVRTIAELRPEARAVVESYLADVREAVRGVDADCAEDVIADVSSDVLARLTRLASGADACAAVRAVGDPCTFGEAPSASREDFGAAPAAARGSGRVLGMPYDLRVPTAERVARSWWNPQDTRVFVPRLFGLGWSVNFGRVAVLARLIEPDAQDEPFCSTPESAFRAALAVPVSIVVVMLVSFLVARGALGTAVVSHWDALGRPDETMPTATAFGWLMAVAALSSAWAVRAQVSGSSPLSRGASAGFAAFMSALSGAIWTLTLVTELTPVRGAWLPPVFILGGLLVPFGVMLSLARAGRAVEIARDTARQS